VLVVGTCPVCLPAGAITWLIENGRQLDMFDPEPAEWRGVVNVERGGDTVDPTQVTPGSAEGSSSAESDLPF